MGYDFGPEASRCPPAAPVQAARGEHWWPVALAILVAAFLHVALPAKYRVNPAWVVPAVLLALLAALITGDPGRIDRQKTWLRIVTGAVIAFLTVANLLAPSTCSMTSSPTTSCSPATPPGCWPPAG